MLPYQKRLLWILKTFGKRFPRQASDTVQILLLVEPTQHWGRPGMSWAEQRDSPQVILNDTWISQHFSDPVAWLTEYVGAVTSPARSPMDRWGRWMFAQVRAAHRLRGGAPMSGAQEARYRSGLTGLVFPFKRARGAGRSTAQEIRGGFRTQSRATRASIATRDRLSEIYSAMPRIREWVEITGASLGALTWRQAYKRAQAWHTRALDTAMDDARRIAGVKAATHVGEVGKGWALVELTTQEALSAEGASLKHCVGQYWGAVASGSSRVFSLRDATGDPRITFQVSNDGKVLQAKGPHNSIVGFASRRPIDLLRSAAPTMKMIENEEGDVEVMAMTLGVVNGRKWSWEESRDMAGVKALVSALQREERDKRGRGNGQRSLMRWPAEKEGKSESLSDPHLQVAPPRRTVGLTYKEAAKLFKRRRKGRNGLWLGGYYLSRVQGKGGTYFTLTSRAKESRYKRSGEIRRVPSRWEGHVQTEYRWDELAAPHEFADVEIWPKHWVIRGHTRRLGRWRGSGTQYAKFSFPGAQFTPLTLIRVPAKMFAMDLRPPMSQVHPEPTRLIAVARQKKLRIKIRNAFKDPDWAFWELYLPRIHSESASRQHPRLRGETQSDLGCPVLAIAVDKAGVPLKVWCENNPPEVLTGKAQWRGW